MTIDQDCEYIQVCGIGVALVLSVSTMKCVFLILVAAMESTNNTTNNILLSPRESHHQHYRDISVIDFLLATSSYKTILKQCSSSIVTPSQPIRL